MWARLGGIALGVAGLSACTAVAVVMHTTDDDPVAAAAGHYLLDPHHWSIVFDVDHLHYARFVMRFDRARADLDFVASAVERSRVDVVIEAASVDTNVPDLNLMVAGPDMLEASRFAEIRFDSTTLTRTSKTAGVMTGDLTIHGVTRPVTLAVTFNGAAPNPLTRQATLGFSATGSIRRADFGLTTWYPAVGDEIRLRIEAEFVKAG